MKLSIMLKNFYYKKKKKCMVHDRLKFIEELNNVKELTLAATSYPFNKHIIKYIDVLIAIYEEEVKQYEDDMWEEHMDKKRNPTYHSFHENFTPDIWKNVTKELEQIKKGEEHAKKYACGERTDKSQYKKTCTCF